MRSTMPASSVALAAAIVAGLAPAATLAQDANGEVAAQPTLTARIAAAINREGKTLGGDPRATHRFVRERIDHEPYQGSLKGERGTYLTGSGSDADQALLMAALIRAGDADARVRFAVCPADGPVADALAARLTATPHRPSLIDVAEEAAELVDDPALRAAILELVAARDEASEAAAAGAPVLAEALVAGGYPWHDAAAPTAAPSVSLGSEHVWLQAEVEGTWTDLDPASESAKAPCLASQTFDELPGRLAHRVTIGVTAEHRLGGELVESQLLATEAPVADLATSRIALVFGEPAGLVDVTSEEGFGLNPDAEAGQATYTPVLRIDAESIVGTSAVELPAVGAFVADEVEDAVGAALELFESLPSGDSAAADGPADDPTSDGLTAIWLDIGLSSPDGEHVSLRSEVLDRLGPVSRADGTAGAAELAPLLEVAGEYAALSALWQVGLLLGGNAVPEGALDPSLDPFTLDGLSGHLDALLRTFPAIRSDLGGGPGRPGAPAVILAGVTPAAEGDDGPGAGLVLDALHVPAVTPADGDAAARDAQATLAAEELLATFVGAAGGGPESVAAVLRAANDAGSRLGLLRPGDEISVGGASPRALARMAARSDEGLPLLVPAEAPVVDGVASLAWWVVDPATGVVRDEHENGRHSQAEAAEGVVRTASYAERMRRFACRVARPVALAATIFYVGTGAPASPIHELLETIVESVEAEAARRAEREALARAACSLG